MTPQEESPDVDRLARSMLMLRGDHNHEDEPAASRGGGSCSRAPDFADNPVRAAEVRAATRADATRYLTSGLQPVDCRFCHATVNVKRLGPGHTAVQWNTAASQRCAYFAELRANGTASARSRSCARLADSIDHAVAEGCLDAVSTAVPPGDG